MTFRVTAFHTRWWILKFYIITLKVLDILQWNECNWIWTIWHTTIKFFIKILGLHWSQFTQKQFSNKIPSLKYLFYKRPCVSAPPNFGLNLTEKCIKIIRLNIKISLITIGLSEKSKIFQCKYICPVLERMVGLVTGYMVTNYPWSN